MFLIEIVFKNKKKNVFLMKKYIRKDNLTRKKVVKNENRRISLKIIQNQCRNVHGTNMKT